MRLKFFNSFLRLLFERGKDEFEDPDVPFPKGYVQIMTIHQSKGLEFPVVVVGSLNRNPRAQKAVDKVLSPFYKKSLFEPEDKIKIFDYLRLYYVAFSRAQKVLALTCSDEPSEYFKGPWDGLKEWPHQEKDLLRSQSFEVKERDKIKKGFSFTSDINTYEECPRQYKFFNDLEFTPSRSAEVFFGSLVHQTIEEIHRYAIEDKLKELKEDKIRDVFEFNFRMLIESGMRPLAQKQKEIAFGQIISYFRQNKQEMKMIKEIEVDVSLEKEKYILNGKIDLVLAKDDKLEILDFKAQKKPKNDPSLIEKYRKQLCIYGHILEQRYKKKPQRLVIYWTGEKDKEKARMVFDYDHLIVDDAVKEFDKVVDKIMSKDFKIKKAPKPEYCRECDIRRYCASKKDINIKITK
jgi:DNA helicase II / ATP-dependent DNA helicase PcrA